MPVKLSHVYRRRRRRTNRHPCVGKISANGVTIATCGIRTGTLARKGVVQSRTGSDAATKTMPDRVCCCSVDDVAGVLCGYRGYVRFDSPWVCTSLPDAYELAEWYIANTAAANWSSPVTERVGKIHHLLEMFELMLAPDQFYSGRVTRNDKDTRVVPAEYCHLITSGNILGRAAIRRSLFGVLAQELACLANQPLQPIERDSIRFGVCSSINQRPGALLARPVCLAGCQTFNSVERDLLDEWVLLDNLAVRPWCARFIGQLVLDKIVMEDRCDGKCKVGQRSKRTSSKRGKIRVFAAASCEPPSQGAIGVGLGLPFSGPLLDPILWGYWHSVRPPQD